MSVCVFCSAHASKQGAPFRVDVAMAMLAYDPYWRAARTPLWWNANSKRIGALLALAVIRRDRLWSTEVVEGATPACWSTPLLLQTGLRDPVVRIDEHVRLIARLVMIIVVIVFVVRRRHNAG